MKRILFTGGTGFLGRNLVPLLSEKYDMDVPSRAELDMRDINALETYIKKDSYDVVIHAAIPNIAFNVLDSEETLLKDSMLTFLQLYRLQGEYGKLLYFGSGAEFDKTAPIVSVSEDDFGKRIPVSDYGIAKYTMNQLCRCSRNIYNLRIFGTYGPTDTRLPQYIMDCCLCGRNIELNQNCIFDYMNVFDLIPVLEYFIENKPVYHDYNICSGTRTELLQICRIIQGELETNLPVYIKKEGYNNEYSGSNARICTEIENIRFTPIEEGISRLVKYEKEKGMDKERIKIYDTRKKTSCRYHC